MSGSIPQHVFAKRRRDFLKQIEKGVALLHNFPGTPNRTNEVRFRPDSYFYYLTGLSEPESAALFNAENSHPYKLYLLPRDKTKEAWDGKRLGVVGAKRRLGADAAAPIDKLESDLRKLISKAGVFHYGMGLYKEYDHAISDLLADYSPNMREGERPLVALNNPLLILNEMRLIKDGYEIKMLEQAAAIATEAFMTTMQRVRAGVYEYEVEALIEHEFRKRGSQGRSFATIVGSGNNATTIHYTENSARLRQGDLVLIDAGCAYNFYASDVTRTLPISGKFNQAQRQIYELVLATQKKVINAVKPGTTYEELNRISKRSLCRGLLKLGLLRGSLSTALKSERFKEFYPHRVSHWLGLDVHDVGDYYEKDGSSKKLRAGMVLTVEPGLYFSKSAKRVPAKYRGMGVRIEDDVLVIKRGCRVLTEGIPKEVDAIESLMRRG